MTRFAREARPYPPAPARASGFVRLGERFDAALAYAAEMHREQSRKASPVPYLSHLLGVASLVLEYGGDESQAMAALLHDTLEDCPGDHAAVIGQRFGPDVLGMVEACSDFDASSRPGAAGPEVSRPGAAGPEVSRPGAAGPEVSRPGAAGPEVSRPGAAGPEVSSGPKPPWRARKQAYVDHLSDLDAGHRALLVSACDKLHNARAIRSDLRELGLPLWDRFSAPAPDQLWYYRSLVRAFSRSLAGPVPAELARTVAGIARLDRALRK